MSSYQIEELHMQTKILEDIATFFQKSEELWIEFDGNS